MKVIKDTTDDLLSGNPKIFKGKRCFGRMSKYVYNDNIILL